jgi:uncharacterized protein YkwD
MGRHGGTDPARARRGTPGTTRRHRRRRHTVLLATCAVLATGTFGVSAGLLPRPDGQGGFTRASGLPGLSALHLPGTRDGSTGVRDLAGVASPPATASPGASGRAGAYGAGTWVGGPASGATASGSPSPKRSPKPSRTTHPARGAVQSAATHPSPAASDGGGVSAAPSASAGSTAPTAAEQTADNEVLRLVNEQRAQAGCSPVTADSKLQALATAFSEEMADRNFFDHTDPDGRTPWDRAKAAGITDLGGENIARGQADPAAVMDAWMNSPGHRANILNCSFTTLGVGVHFGTGGPWWTQDFGY